MRYRSSAFTSIKTPIYLPSILRLGSKLWQERLVFCSWIGIRISDQAQQSTVVDDPAVMPDIAIVWSVLIHIAPKYGLHDQGHRHRT